MKIIITIFLLIFLTPSSDAEMMLKLKNGNVMTWSNLIEEDGQYNCTQKSIGKFCIPKDVVVSISKEDENPDAVVIVNESTKDSESSNVAKEIIKKIEDDLAECKRLWNEIVRLIPDATKGDITFKGIIIAKQKRSNLKLMLEMYKVRCRN